MKLLSQASQQRAARYVTTNARVLERRRYDHLFAGGPVAPVLTALEAYRNPDGGYGHALEPDGRGPGSQPVHVLMALSVLDEIGELHGELAAGICDYLASISADDGGLPIVHPNIADHPRPPWWEIPASYEGSVIPTANIAGLLHKNKVDHPWLARASRFCVQAIAALDAESLMVYSARAAVEFLEHTPARDWAAREAARLGEVVRANRVVMLPDAEAARPAGFAEGEVFYPHYLAPRPDSIARSWFSEQELQWSLDQLIGGQQEDGGWLVPWAIWTPVIEHEWRPVLTIEALLTLRAAGRLD